MLMITVFLDYPLQSYVTFCASYSAGTASLLHILNNSKDVKKMEIMKDGVVVDVKHDLNWHFQKCDPNIDTRPSPLLEEPNKRRPKLKELSEANKAARKPPPPEELVDARYDRVHRDIGHGRAVQTVRKPLPRNHNKG